MARHFAANALTFLIVGLVLLFGVITWGKSQFDGPGPLAEPLRIEVARGERFASVVERLEDDGAISSGFVFRMGARYTGSDEGLKFGEYEIPAGASMASILELLNRGGNVFRQIVVPEGWTSWQVVEMLRAQEELTGEIPEIPAEGSLAPAGYDYQKGDSRAGILERMHDKQLEYLAEAWIQRDPDLPLSTPEELLVLASIVEKETGLAEERGLVASVFVNRLERGMRLQTDPTVIYGITKGEGTLGRGLRRSELNAPTEYNTYVIDGLPPTPIANPGREAIMATANPPDSPFLFFVADGTGGHAFAETLEEHNQNVAVWRRLEAERALDAKQEEEASSTGN
ncbi:endolytic transglycosylase MltG [Amaricoccus tamworthensis]|uniref:endolytic transglycosylase MltG n=1 Tax=Amaricoccus tamworthensis TaxID=57002 RepID=UPI003C79D0CE